MKKKAALLFAFLFLLIPAVSLADSFGTAYRTGDGWSFSTDMFGNALLRDAEHPASGIVKIPDELLGHRITGIGPGTIRASQGSHIILPEGVVQIGENAFSGNYFSVYIPASVTEIRAAAFLNCSRITIYAPAGSAAAAFAEANRILLVTDPRQIRNRESVPSDVDYSIYSEACHDYDRGHYRRAFCLLYRIADSSNPHAALLLGECLTHGRGAARNKYAAFDYYKIAADAGLARAQYETGRCLIQGSGVSRNLEEAVRYFRMAADQQEPIAWLWLGYCYQKGLGVPRDYDMAEDLYTRAARANVHYAPTRLEELARDRAKGN